MALPMTSSSAADFLPRLPIFVKPSNLNCYGLAKTRSMLRSLSRSVERSDSPPGTIEKTRPADEMPRLELLAKPSNLLIAYGSLRAGLARSGRICPAFCANKRQQYWMRLFLLLGRRQRTSAGMSQPETNKGNGLPVCHINRDTPHCRKTLSANSGDVGSELIHVSHTLSQTRHHWRERSSGVDPERT